MTELPKIVVRRLQADAFEQTAQNAAHPEADLLSAFAEQALSAAERDGVLHHLARCADCREVIALALPEVEEAGSPTPGAHSGDALGPMIPKSGQPAKQGPKRMNLGLRWAAVVAGVAVAAVLTLRPGKVVAPQTPSAVAKSRPQSSSNASLIPSIPDPSPMLLAGNGKQTGAPGSPSLSNSARARAKFSERSPAVARVPVPHVDDRVEISTSSDDLVALNQFPAIEKAKPVPQVIEEASQQQESSPANGPPLADIESAAEANTTGTTAASQPAIQTAIRTVTWVVADGALQRSLDNGRSWQNAFHPQHPILCYASSDGDVWTGGTSATLFHSVDGGETWAQIHPALGAEQLSGDVLHIELPAPREILISTGNHETWVSADGGSTWNKK
jgi:hypothetical protein